MALALLRTLRCDARCCGGGVDRKELLIKGLAFFFLCGLTLQYAMTAFLTSKHPLQRQSLETSGLGITVHRNSSHTHSAVILRTLSNSALTSAFPKTPTPRTLALPLALDDVILNRNYSHRKSVPLRSPVAPSVHADHPPALPKVANETHGDSPQLPVEVVNHKVIAKQAAEDAKQLPEEIEIPPSLLNDTDNDKDSTYCPRKPPNLVGEIPVTFDMPTLSELEEELPEMMKGGRWRPKNCQPRHRVAIIIPYRDREEHLRIFLAHIHPFLQKQLIEYGIYLVEQNPKGRFNRAMLMNIGFMEAMRLHDYDCCIFHDVDLLPEDDRNLYTCPTLPRHMSAAVDTFGYRLPYNTIFGGVTALSASQFRMVNGFSNMFFGWGGEDDDMCARIKFHKLRIRRYPMHISRYRMIRHLKESPNPSRYDYLKTGRARFRSDGLNGLKYKLRWVQEKKLFTWLMVDISEKDVLSMNPLPEVRTVLPLDQAEGHGNEARRRMKEMEEQERTKRQTATGQREESSSRFDVDGYPDDGQDIKGGLTILSADDVRRAKAKLKAQISDKLNKMKDAKRLKSRASGRR